MTQKGILIIALVALVLLMIPSVNAETLTGTIEGSNYTQKYIDVRSQSSAAENIKTLAIKGIEYTDGLKSVVMFANTVWNYDANSPPGSTTTVRINVTNNRTIATGTIGYQRLFQTNTPYNELPGYFWLQLNDWNITGLSGDYIATINFNGGQSALYNTTAVYTKSTIAAYPVGSIAFGSSGTALIANFGNVGSENTYQLTFSSYFKNEYTVTKPQGIGISGTIDKLGYNSRVFIINKTDNRAATSESTVTSNNFIFSVPDQSIYIAILDSKNNWWNTSALFDISVTPTPTTTIPAGYVRTYFTALDGQTNGVIQDVNIQLLDVEADRWTNYTSDWDGTGYIDTLPSHTINAYANAVGYISMSRLGLNAFDGSYPLILFATGMFPPILGGNVNLVVMVTDEITQQPLMSVELAAYMPNGSALGGVTGSSGQEVFTVPNATIIRVGASKPGYQNTNGVIKTSNVGPDYLRIDLQRETITPTPTRTVVPGEVTVRPTVDPLSPEQNNGDTSLKAQEMMNFIANNGLTIVELCFMVTIFALLGVKLGK